MGKIIIIGIIYICLLTLFVILNYINDRTKNKLIKLYKDALTKSYKNNDEIVTWCLQYIVKQSVEQEDFETAQRCLEIIKTHENNRKQRSNNK